MCLLAVTALVCCECLLQENNCLARVSRRICNYGLGNAAGVCLQQGRSRRIPQSTSLYRQSKRSMWNIRHETPSSRFARGVCSQASATAPCATRKECFGMCGAIKRHGQTFLQRALSGKATLQPSPAPGAVRASTEAFYLMEINF